MNLREIEQFNLHDAIFFHNELNPVIFNGDRMDPEVRKQLLVIAEDFVDHLGIPHLNVSDVTLSGSNAAYTYTKHSDIDLHILVDINALENDVIYRELFDAKKILYNNTHDITIGGYDVELYVQDTNQPVISLGEYSIVFDKWIRLPRKRKADPDQASAKLKFNKLARLANLALKHSYYESMNHVLATIKKYRQTGLDMHGEFSPENLAFKALRSKGIIEKLRNKRDELHSNQLSLPESMVEGASGYIPSPKQKNDPRFKTALTVDVTPYSIQDNAKKLGSKVSRAGIPPLLRP